MPRRRPAAATASADIEADVNGDSGADPEKQHLGFFDYMAGLEPAVLEHCLVYIYRQDPKIRNPKDASHYIEKAVPPIDEEYIAKKWGSGQYLLQLKNVKENKLLRTKVFTVDPSVGRPKYAPGTTLVDQSQAGDANNGGQPSSPAVITATDLAGVLSKAMDMMRSENKPAGDALASAMSVLSQAQKGAMEIVISSAKNMVEDKTAKVDPIEAFKSMAAALRDMQGLTSGDRKSSISELKDVFGTVRELQLLVAGDQTKERRGGNSLLDEIRALVELKKADTDGSLLSMVLKVRSEDDEPAGPWNTVAKLGMQLVEKRPDVLGSLADLISGLASRIMATPPTVGTPATALAGSPPAETAKPLTQTPPTILPPEGKQSQPAKEEVMLEDFLQIIARGYRSTLENEFESNGEAVAMSVITIFPDLVPIVKAQLTQYADPLIITWMRAQKPTAEIAALPDFPQFLADFRAVLFEPLTVETEAEASEAGEKESAAAAGGLPV